MHRSGADPIVLFDSFQSNEFKVMSKVLQASHIGPILFALFTKNFHS